MQTIKTSELTGAALDWAVANCEDGVNIDATGLPWLPDESPNDSGEAVWFKPSTNWAQGGPIIERERISLLTFGLVNWKATFDYGGSSTSDQYGPTPLITAMRCYVASKLGDTVEVPTELTK